MEPTSNKKTNPLQKITPDNKTKDETEMLETEASASGTSIGHRSISYVAPSFSQMKESEVSSLPLDVEYTYHKSGKSIPLCNPRVNNHHFESITFEVKHYSLDCLSESEKKELGKIRDDLTDWLKFLTHVKLTFTKQHSLSQFSRECSKHIEAAISQDSKHPSSWKNKHLFVVLINDPDNIFNIDKVVSGISYCKDFGHRDMFIYQSIANPKFQDETDGSLVVRGSGRALKQGIINFVESSDHYRSASSMPINNISAYLNYVLGFRAEVESKNEDSD